MYAWKGIPVDLLLTQEDQNILKNVPIGALKKLLTEK